MDEATQLKAQLKRLGDQRAQLEAQIAVRSGRLQAAGVGMDAPLVDSEGFPRADVDVAAIRADRHAIITLTNDHKALSKQVEQLLHHLHSLSNEAGGAPSAPAPAAPAPAAPLPLAAAAAAAGGGYAGPPPPPPFAVIDELTPGSPAAEAGLQLGDQLCRFGEVTRDAPSTLQAVAAALAAHEGRPVAAVVLRQGAPVALQLTPRQWGGRGLLGCHLRPL